jgi:hypothetical protein
MLLHQHFQSLAHVEIVVEGSLDAPLSVGGLIEKKILYGCTKKLDA